MGGQLEVESDTGRGSTFTFAVRLALAPAMAAPSGLSQGRIPHSCESLLILLAEDNAINQKVAVRLLERMGHRVDIAADGLQAVNAVMRCAYDVVLMDCQMPQMDGYAATQAIRQLDLGCSIPIVAMTASATPETQRHCQDAGMNYFLSKPVAAARLYDVLEKISAAKHPDLVASPGEQVSAGQPPDGA